MIAVKRSDNVRSRPEETSLVKDRDKDRILINQSWCPTDQQRPGLHQHVVTRMLKRPFVGLVFLFTAALMFLAAGLRPEQAMAAVLTMTDRQRPLPKRREQGE